jgi:hypothetical protein
MPMLLGGGKVENSGRKNVLWTDPDDPGVRDAARQLGYKGPANMAFLHLDSVVFPDVKPPGVPMAGTLSSGLNSLNEEQARILAVALPIV